MTKTKSPETTALTIGGIVVERQVNVLALTSFFLALAAAVSQFAWFLRGPDVDMAVSERITFFLDNYPNNRTILRFSAPISFVNSGSKDYGAILESLSARFQLREREYVQAWQSFQKLERRGSALIFVNEGDARPIHIAGASTIGQSVSFAPRPVRCKSPECNEFANYLTDTEFFGKYEKPFTLRLNFEARIFNSSEIVKQNCELEVNDGFITQLMMNRWVTAQCWRMDSR